MSLNPIIRQYDADSREILVEAREFLDPKKVEEIISMPADQVISFFQNENIGVPKLLEQMNLAKIDSIQSGIGIALEKAKWVNQYLSCLLELQSLPQNSEDDPDKIQAAVDFARSAAISNYAQANAQQERIKTELFTSPDDELERQVANTMDEDLMIPRERQPTNRSRQEIIGDISQSLMQYAEACLSSARIKLTEVQDKVGLVNLATLHAEDKPMPDIVMNQLVREARESAAAASLSIPSALAIGRECLIVALDIQAQKSFKPVAVPALHVPVP